MLRIILLFHARPNWMRGTTASAARTLFSVILKNCFTTFLKSRRHLFFCAFVLKERRHLEAADGPEAASRHLGKESTHQAAGATERGRVRRWRWERRKGHDHLGEILYQWQKGWMSLSPRPETSEKPLSRTSAFYYLVPPTGRDDEMRSRGNISHLWLRLSHGTDWNVKKM